MNVEVSQYSPGDRVKHVIHTDHGVVTAIMFDGHWSFRVSFSPTCVIWCESAELTQDVPLEMKRA